MQISITSTSTLLLSWLTFFVLCVIAHRPFQRTITMHKDSSGHVGFIFKSGRITSLVKDGSAARNGLLTDHYICEINGQNVIGLKVTEQQVTEELNCIKMFATLNNTNKPPVHIYIHELFCLVLVMYRNNCIAC